MTTKFGWCFPTDKQHDLCVREFTVAGKHYECSCPNHHIKKSPATHPEEFPHFRDGVHDDSATVSESGGIHVEEVAIPKKRRRRSTKPE